MFANSLRPLGRAYRMTPSHVETVAGRLNRLPKSPAVVTVAPRCSGTGRAKEDRQVRRDVFQKEFIMDGKRKTPKPMALGAVRACEDTDAGNNTAPASIRRTAWWGRQACTCHGNGTCLCCLRFDRAIRAHQARVAAAGGC